MRTVILSCYLDQRLSYVVTTSQLTLRDVVKIKPKFCPWRYLATEKEMKWTTSKMEKAAAYKFVDRSTGWVCNEDWVLNICRRIFSQGVLRFSRENLQLVYALETYFRHVTKVWDCRKPYYSKLWLLEAIDQHCKLFGTFFFNPSPYWILNNSFGHLRFQGR